MLNTKYQILNTRYDYSMSYVASEKLNTKYEILNTKI